MARIIALLTDFGTVDPYVGAMKGAILSVCPEANLVDLVHDVPAHDVLAGAMALDAAYPVFPEATVFVAVVDPGVGSARRGLAIRAGAYVFVGPDNGLFTFVLRTHPEARVHEITNPGLGRAPRSPVFHGRDLFGPVAGSVLVPFVTTYADVARGTPCALLGSSGRLEVAVREGSAAVVLGAGMGAAVRVTW